MTDRERFPLTSENAQILKESCRAYSIAAEKKFGCKVVVHNVDDFPASFTGSNKWSIVPKIKYSKQLPGGVKISVWQDDLTTHKADAVVNAANEKLKHAGGLALALSLAGGPEIQQMSDHIVQSCGPVPTGEAVCTRAGKLPCNHIIHAVGPYVSRNPSQNEIAAARPYLESAIWSIFRVADHNHLQSVAIPAISSGLYNFPRDTCADIIVNTVILFSSQRKTGQSLEVRLVNNDDPSVQEMQRACQQFLGPSDLQSGAMQSQSMASTKPTWSSLELGNVTLSLKKGHIEDETTDVIVNTIGADLDLSSGYVSNAILQKAGNGIQDEIKKRRPKHVSVGHVIGTASHNLKANAVFHTICAGSHHPTTHILHKVITRCLEMTNKENFSSISFPAIGTGNLGLGKEEVSQKMISAVVDFAKTYRGSKKNVYFVIFPADTDKYEAFKKEMASVEKKTSKFFSNTDKSSMFQTPEETRETTPHIEFFANSCEAVREAKKWTLKMLHISSGGITIQNNHVIQFGQEDHEKLMSLQTIHNVSISESFRDGKCSIIIKGVSTGVSCAALEVEAMLCQAQEDFAQAEENDLLHSVVCWQAFPGSEEPDINAALEKAYLAKKDTFDLAVEGQKITVDLKQMLIKSETERGFVHRISFFSLYTKLPELNSKSYYERTTISERFTEKRKAKFNKYGLDIVKVEKIENNALKQVFELNKRWVPGQPQLLYQRVTAQFCELISRVGFQRDYAPPKEQNCGAGIYFTSELGKATRLWQGIEEEEEYIYIIEAQVLTGNHTRGSSQLIVPPPSETVPQAHYDSVCNDTKDTFVIFNGQQALPDFIYTCTDITRRGQF
ncbi:protein mono-ADP-ribosyltransferase PARP9 [Salminus brasiliensis]|uniref:protein mono-ADP-ribosyltransferase PARP9 n=1 Tax=Salminus brasiliensis TaxID=930266 RepID=UPI003B8337F0